MNPTKCLRHGSPTVGLPSSVNLHTVCRNIYLTEISLNVTFINQSHSDDAHLDTKDLGSS